MGLNTVLILSRKIFVKPDTISERVALGSATLAIVSRFTTKSNPIFYRMFILLSSRFTRH